MCGITDLDEFCADHVRCVRNKGFQKLDYFPVGSWFCSKRCEQVFGFMPNTGVEIIDIMSSTISFQLSH